MTLRPKTTLKRIAIKCLCILFSVITCQGLRAQPVITAFSPASGPVGSTVTITGSGFDNTIANNIVYFGAVKATITAASNNSLTVSVPSGATHEPIAVTTNNLTGYSNKPFSTTFAGVINQSSATSFSQVIDIQTRQGPLDVAMGDLNDDGKPDFVAVGGYQQFEVMENISTTGQFSFRNNFFYDFPLSGSQVSLSDLNGDGKTDVVVANYASFVFMKNASSGGNLSLSRDTSFSDFGFGNTQQFLRDMDSDGKPDMIVLHSYAPNDTSKLFIYKNTTMNGKISFAKKVEIAYIKRLQEFSIADMDSDGKAEIVTLNVENNTISVWKNTSTPAGFSFTENNVSAVVPNSGSLALGDLDNDGKPEIVYATKGLLVDGKTISILKNTTNTNISFAPKVDLVTGIGPMYIGINDLNGDGKPDLAVINAADNTLSVFYNNGNGTLSFTARNDYPGGSKGLQNIYFGDLNGDNIPEIASKGGSFSIFKNQLTIDAGRFVPPVITSFSPLSGAVGSTVTITGTGFSPVAINNAVYFGAVKATITAASPTSITVIVPPQTTPAPISVTRELLTAYSAKPFRVTYAGSEAPFTSNFFAARVDSMVNGAARDYCVSDLDGDGKPDLVVPQYDWGRTSSVSIYRNTGSPGTIAFAPKMDLPSTGAIGVIAADMNGDGKPDLIMRDHKTEIFINTSTPGAISFRKPYIIDKTLRSTGWSGGEPAMALGVGDFDGDGRTDLAVSDYYGVWIGRNMTVNDSVFFQPYSYTVGEEIKGISVTDITGDGKPDIALVCKFDKKVTVLRNTGTPGKISFATGPDLPTGDYSYDVATGDLDNDGKMDVAVVDYFDSTLSVYRNISAGGSYGFAQRVKYKTGYNACRLAINDLNGDGKEDILVMNQYDSTLSAFKNTSSAGTMSFDAQTVFKTGPMPNFTGAADWDGDGMYDVVVCNEKFFSFYQNKSLQPVISSFTPVVVAPGTTVTINGYNFTNATEVKLGSVSVQSFTVVSATQITAVVGQGAEGDVMVKTAAGTGVLAGITFAAPVITSFTPAAAPVGTTVTITGSNFSSVAANNHVYFGAVQAVVNTATTTSLTVQVPAGASSCNAISVSTFNTIGWSAQPFVVTFPGIGNAFTAASFANKIDITVGKNPKGVAAGDLDGDGLPDLAVANYDDRSISILKNSGAPGQVQYAASIHLPLSITPSAIAMVDVNADGKLDVIVTDHYYGNFIVLINNSNAGIIALANPVSFATKERGIDLAAGDFDQDGKTDLVIINEDWTDGLWIMRNTSANGVISFSRMPRFDFGYYYNPISVAVADMNNDSKPDLMVSYNLGKTVKVYKNLSSNGNITFDTSPPINLGDLSSPYGVAAADMDGDGKPEMALIVDRAYYGEWIYVFKNTSLSGGALSFGAVSTLPGDINFGSVSLGIGDMDGDGKVDIVSGSPWDDSVLVFKNASTAGAISFLPRVGYLTSNKPYRVCLADVDIDGKSDIVSVSTSTGNVSILRNKIGEPLVLPSGAKPVTGNIVNNLTIDASVQTLNGSAYVQRHYDIMPANDPASATATVTLYFTQADFDNFNAYAGHGPDLPKNTNDATGKANVRIYQYHGFSTTSLPGTYTGQGKEIDPDDANIIWNANLQWWEISFDVNGFSGFFLSSVGFNYNQVPAPVVTALGATSFCTGGSVVLVSSLDKSNQWYKDGVAINGAITSVYQAGTSGTYTVTATNNGITSPQSVGKAIVVNALPAKPVITQNGSDLVSSILTGNQWYQDGVLIPGANGQSYKPAVTGNYSVIATAGVCTGPESARYYYLSTGIINLDDNQFISLAPNPVKDKAYLNFKLNGITILTVQMVNMRGQVCGGSRTMSNGNALDVRGLPGGMYFVQIISTAGKLNYTLKLIKL
jgi:hypothetical protein